MKDFATAYSRVFESLARPLKRNDGLSARTISSGERRLGITLPHAVREYYRVAGAEKRFNGIHNQLLSPSEWFLDSEYIAFMEGHQTVVYWGFRARGDHADDPPVFQGVNGDRIAWYEEHSHGSVFLSVMVVWQATFGGAMHSVATSLAKNGTRQLLDAEWSFVGEVNRMRAYVHTGRGVCLVPWEDGERIFAGSTSRKSLITVAAELGVIWDAT